MWSEVVHPVWGLQGGTDQGQPSPMFFLGKPSMSYKVICRWLLLVLGFEVPQRDQAVNQGWLLLMSGLGPFSERYGAH